MTGLILHPQWSEAAKAIGRPAATSAKQIVAFNVWGFAAGIIAVWLYAAMRPRFGPGPRTAIRAGAAVWLLAHAMANGMMAFLDRKSGSGCMAPGPRHGKRNDGLP